MQINIKQEELEIAVRDYILKAGITRSVGAISFTATRAGGSGTTAEIEITDAPVSEGGHTANIREKQSAKTKIAPMSAPVDTTETETFGPINGTEKDVIESDVEADVDSSASLFA
jgi:hypothetical protein